MGRWERRQHRPADRGGPVDLAVGPNPKEASGQKPLVSEGTDADIEGVEAARIAWRPLGRLLVEQGLLTDDELERALVLQQATGKRLGETIVELGFVSGPDLASALATQYGIELTVETGFGTGLRAQIQRRHENDRGIPGPPALSIVETPAAEPEDYSRAVEGDQAEMDGAAEALLLRQLEEQWARLAAAEEALAESEREIGALRHERDHRRKQAVRLVGRVRERERRVELPHEELEHLGRTAEEQLSEIERLTDDAKNRDAEIERLTRDVKERNAESEREIGALRHERDHRRKQAVRLVGRVRDRERRLELPHDELEHLGRAAEEQLGEIERLTDDAKNRDAEIERLTRDVKERDAEIERLVGEGQNRNAEIDRLTRDVEDRTNEIDRLTSDAKNRSAEIDRLVSKAKERHVEIERLTHEVKDRNAEIERLTRDAEDRDAGIDRITDEANGRKAEIERLTGEAKHRNAEVERLTNEIANRKAEIERLTDETKSRNSEIERLTNDAKNRIAEIERLTGDVAGCDAEIERLRQESDRLRAQAIRFATRLRREPESQQSHLPAPAPAPSSHLVFVQLGDGYELVESDGPPPPLHTLLELPQFSEAEFVVTRLGHSPLPADARSCIFVQRV
jgi:peptidoglycan hydrolase CwlO-like protein